MSYNKTNWVSGDVITAEKLNNIEEGIESVAGSGLSGVLVLSIVDGQKNDKILNRSAKEIVDTFKNNTPIFVRLDEENPENLGEDSIAYHLLYVNTIEKMALDPHDIVVEGFTDGIRITLRTPVTEHEYELKTSTNGTSYYPEYFTSNPEQYLGQPIDDGGR